MSGGTGAGSAADTSVNGRAGGGLELRLGVCASMISPERDPIGIAAIETAAALGFDYIELSLAHLAALPDGEFAALMARVERSGLRCEACNNFFPPQVRLTGPAADLQAALDYAEAAMARAARLGVEVIVLGSSGAKNVPDGFPPEAARDQLLALLHELAPAAEAHGITIALEPISRPEANFIIRAAEALELGRAVAHPHVGLLVDFYHLATEDEDPAIVRLAASELRHLHFATPGARAFPATWEQQYDPFFGALSNVHYRGRMSIEAYTSDFAADGAKALRVLRPALAGYAP